MIKLTFKTKKQKLNFIIITVLVILISSVSIATLARYKNRNPLNINEEWDGSVATSYRSGTGQKSDPYIISSASELAYFSKMLETEDYKDKYFLLNNDIIINKGIFKYQDNNIEYILDDKTYYLKKYTNNYYNDTNYDNKVSDINNFNSLNNFKGTFDGGSHTIYGMYITNENVDELGIFTNLNGNIKDLYIENSLISGGNITGGLASIATDTTISNIVYDGYVIGNETGSKTTESSLENINLNTETKEVTKTLDILDFDILEITLKGEVNELPENTSISVNGINIEEKSFSITIPTTKELNFSLNSLNDTNITLSNLKYTIKYKLGMTGGIVGKTINTNLTNIVNKANVNGLNYVGGISAFSTNTLNLKRSYNLGQIISSNESSGLITYLKNATATITNVYNNGNLNGTSKVGIIANSIDSTINIANSFNTIDDSYFIGTNSNSNINIQNSYNINNNYIINGSYNGYITLTDTAYLKTKENTENLEYTEFVDTDTITNNENATWIYDINNYPLLYIDDLTNPVASININTYSWNNLSFDLNKVMLKDNITFNITKLNNLSGIKSIYYYVSNNTTPLTYQEIKNITDWTLYQNNEKIEQEGYYIIYAKIIDYNDNETYINSDLLVLDLTGSKINITYDERNFSLLNSNPSNYFITEPLNITINALDDLSEIQSVSYCIRENALTENDLETIENWIPYTGTLSITNSGIVYVKVVNNIGLVSYANTDKLIYEGYINTALYLRNDENTSFEKLNITENSSVTLKYEYNSEYTLDSLDKNYLVANQELPINTKIILNLNNEIYSHKITKDDVIKKDSMYLYSFDLFNLIGKNKEIKFKRNLDNPLNDTYKVTLDFLNTTIENDISDLTLSIEVFNEESKVRSTIKDTLKRINIYKNYNPEILLTSSYNDEIIYNTNSTNNIDISLNKIFKTIDSLKVFDSTYNNMFWGLQLKVTDSNGSVVDHSYLKNIMYELDNNKYSMSKDSININLLDKNDQLNKTLKIITSIDNSTLPNGTYYIEITGYLSLDGEIPNVTTNKLLIPLQVTNSRNNFNYTFDIVDNNSKILNKTNEPTTLNYTTNYSGWLASPKVYVSLLKKNNLTAYDTSYSQLDLNSYIADTLPTNNMLYLVKDNLYNNNNITLNLNTNKLDYNLYKLRFYLYNDDKMISFVEKPFIIK